jgi:hypothetical protein
MTAVLAAALAFALLGWWAEHRQKVYSRAEGKLRLACINRLHHEIRELEIHVSEIDETREQIAMDNRALRGEWEQVTP